MKTIKFSKTWTVEVNDEDSVAVGKKLMDSDPDKYLQSETVTVTKTELKSQKQTGGWANGFREQLLGTNGKR